MKSSQGSQIRTRKPTREMKLQQILNIKNQENLKPPPPQYMYGVTNYREMVEHLAIAIERNNITAKHSQMKRKKSM
jgi:hypothetical protein